MTSPKHSPSEKAQVGITSIEPNDVVLGRGNHIHIDGNTKFRQLVHARSTEYWSCQDNFAKDLIARQIVETVTSRGGRFLRKVRTSGEDQWELANKETVLVKVKQTFRDFSASHRKQQSAAAASKSRSTNTASHIAAATAASMSTVSTSIPNSLLRTEGESSTTTTSTISADQLPASLSRAALPTDFLLSRPSALPALPAPDIQELLLLRELRANELNRILSNEMLQRLSPTPPQQQYSAVRAQDRPARSLLEQASLMHLLPPSSSAQDSSLLPSWDQQLSNLLANRQFHPPPSLSTTADVSDLYRRLLQQRTEIPQHSIQSAASLLDLSSTASSTTAYQDALRQSLSVRRLLEELSQQQPSQQLQQLLTQERQQVLPSFFQSSIASTIAPTDRIPLLNLRSSQARGLAANMGAMAALGERLSEGKEQSPQSERKSAPPEDDSSGSELNGTD